MNEVKSPYNKSHPFAASIKQRYSLCLPGSKKMTHHVELDISNSGLTYNVGDSIGIYPSYDPMLVQGTIDALGASGEETVVEKHAGGTYSLREFLTRRANINEISRKLFTEVAQRQTNPKKKEHLDFLLREGNKEPLKEYLKNREVWDFLLENQEVRFSPDEFNHLLMPMLPRFYSIASSIKAVGEEVHLTVSYVKYTSNGHMRLGVCSHFLCDLAPLNQPVIPVYVQPSHGFTVPADMDADLIMIGPGTGIAPFRAFMQERMISGANGKNWLFFGEWNRATNYFYEDFWADLEAKGKLRMDVAFSRDQEHKIYVQHRMRENSKEIFKWLDSGAYFYVCGDAHRMAKDVDAELHRIIQEQGQMDEHAAKAYIKNLRSEKRYLRDVY